MVSVPGYRAWFSAMRSRARFISPALAVVVLLCGVTSQPLQAQTYKVLHTFLGANQGDGSNPVASLVRDSGGNLYGTTSRGGRGSGIVFRVSSTGKYSQPYYFRGGKDGKLVLAGLTLDPAENLYGTTWFGGDVTCNCGMVFKVGKTGKETVLHPFKGNPTDGSSPAAGLIRDSSGNFYGTAYAGGANDFGVIFRLAPDRTETVLYNFVGGRNGFFPRAGLLRDVAGNLYGTTEGGGTSGSYGTVFKLAPRETETVLHAFAGGTDGIAPLAGLIMDAKGNLYGTTSAGGDLACNCGTVFRLNARGAETVLHRFTGTEGSAPQAGLVRDAKGNLYGTASRGGAFGFGTVFKLSTAGVFKVLYSFRGEADGSIPEADLIMDSAGNLYGTASQGGNQQNDCRDVDGCGVVFEVIP